MKIGIIKETKIPEDNRVALTPKQIQILKECNPHVDFIVQPSELRAIGDDEYREAGINVSDDLKACDILFGIKEADVNTLIPNKHYFFFGHIAKMQPYNRPLIKKMIDLNITFTDYEYLVDNNNFRLCAFGWWAGVVGAYNTLRAYGIRSDAFELPKPNKKFTLDYLLSEVRKHQYDTLKIVVTGNGRVSQGAQFVLDNIGIKKIEAQEFLNLEDEEKMPVYTVLGLSDLVTHKEEEAFFDRTDFKLNPTLYKSCFLPYAYIANVFIPCHFWQPDHPIYLSKDDLKDKNLNLKIIGDVTCDIDGSVASTIKPSTHDNPFYDYNPKTGQEESSFSSENNITIMAVDTLPNALAIDTSNYFGESLMKYIFEDLLTKNIEQNAVIARATILKKGKLTDKYSYLHDYASV